mgnify:CR=1 FL=1
MIVVNFEMALHHDGAKRLQSAIRQELGRGFAVELDAISAEQHILRIKPHIKSLPAFNLKDWEAELPRQLAEAKRRAEVNATLVGQLIYTNGMVV